MIPSWVYRMLGMLPRREVEKRIRRHLAPRFAASATQILHSEFAPNEIMLSRLHVILNEMPDVQKCVHKNTRVMQWRLMYNS